MIRMMLFFLGMTAMATQVIMIREALAIFHGNELVIGLFMGLWMGLTAVGAYLSIPGSRFQVPGSRFQVPGSKSKIDHRPSTIDNSSPLPRFPASLLLLLTLLPMATLFLMVILRFNFIPAGIMPGLGQTALVIFLSLLPFCLVSGMLFPFLVKELSAIKGKNLLHEAYALDSVGSIIGGLFFSLFFIFYLPPYESLILLTLICLSAFMTVALIMKRWIIATSILVAAITLFSLDKIYVPARFLDKLQFNKQTVIEIKSTPHGMIAVTRIGEQLFIYENGVPVSSGDDIVHREESVHYAMLMHPEPGKVLLISGGYAGIIDEILKYPIEKAVYVETDQWLFRTIDKYKPFPKDHRINYILKDPRIFLAKTEEKYDVILVNTPEPNSAEMNRFYTVEFYKLLKDRLNPGGIVSVSIPAAGNYMNETSRKVHSVNYNTLHSVFNHIRLIPGGKDYFLASDSTIEQSIFNDYQSKGIENEYVNPGYIDETLLKMRSELILKDLLPDEPLNSDLRPYVFSLFLRQWLEQFKMNQWVIPLILILVLVLSLISLGPLNLGLFAGGFTASSLEFILLIWLQVIYGHVYQMTGVIFALFMAGLALGSWFLANRFKQKRFKGFLKIQGIFAVFSALIAALFFFVSSSPYPLFPSSPLPLVPSSPLPLVPSSTLPLVSSSPLLPLIMTLVFLTGLLTGTQFSYSAHLRKTSVIKSSGESFSADLLGSAVGIILISVYVIPLIGLPMTALALAGLNVLVVGVVAMKSRQSAVSSHQ